MKTVHNRFYNTLPKIGISQRLMAEEMVYVNLLKI